jgi:hypothetical protein
VSIYRFQQSLEINKNEFISTPCPNGAVYGVDMKHTMCRNQMGLRPDYMGQRWTLVVIDKVRPAFRRELALPTCRKCKELGFGLNSTAESRVNTNTILATTGVPGAPACIGATTTAVPLTTGSASTAITTCAITSSATRAGTELA